MILELHIRVVFLDFAERKRKKKSAAEWREKMDEIEEKQKQRDHELEVRERQRRNAILKGTPAVMKPTKPFVPR